MCLILLIFKRGSDGKQFALPMLYFEDSYALSIVNSFYCYCINLNRIISKLPDIHCPLLYANHPSHESLLCWDQFGSTWVLFLCPQSHTLPKKENS